MLEMDALSNDVVVETNDLWRTYKMGTGQDVQALRGVDLKLRAGRLAALRGRSGSGKTTLLNLIGGLDQPTSGVVRLFGDDISRFSESQLTRFRREQIGFVFQSFGLSPTYSAYENVELILRIAGLGRRERHERTLYCLELVGLTKRRNHRPDELSGGQQQRVAIARALANQPRLILADEPTGELDSVTAREICALFEKLVAEENLTVLISSHDPLVGEYADETLMIKDGQITGGGGTGV